jgi:hypothetical protein
MLYSFQGEKAQLQECVLRCDSMEASLERFWDYLKGELRVREE